MGKERLVSSARLSEWRARARDAPICLLELLRFGQGGSSLRDACCLMSVELASAFLYADVLREICIKLTDEDKGSSKEHGGTSA